MLDHPSPASGAHRSYGVERRGTDSAILGEDAVAEEAPVALVYNGFSHAAMPSLSVKPSAKSSRSCGVASITAWEKPL